MPSFEELVESVNEKPPQVRIIILLVIVAILSGLFWYFYWQPKSQELKRLESNLQKRTKLKNEYENIARELPKFQAEFDRLSREFQEASKKLPVNKEIPALIDSIYSSINASGLRPISFDPKREVQKDVYIEIPIALDVRGSYFELANFFDRISKLPRIVNIRDLNLTRAKTSGNEVELSAKFSAITFRIKPIQQTTANNGSKTIKRKKRR